MTYRWGFDLDMTAVRLMRREGGQWRQVAIEKIDSPDIEDRLQLMVGRIDNDDPVELFLPKDQILYTDVNVPTDNAVLAEIDRAMDGRTPYTLDELEIDWEMTGPNTARIAAIARETLGEAAAFADARGKRVSGFSTLASIEDFPRLPDFGGANLFDDENGVASETSTSAQFATAREPSRPNGPVASLAATQPNSDQPVVQVDDTTPVMHVKAPAPPPLDPGVPLSTPTSVPRVRTDIAAATVSTRAASLTPTAASLKVRRQAGAPLGTAVVFLVALLSTIGIAYVVWSIIPLGPGKSALQPEAAAPLPDLSSVAPVPRPVPAPDRIEEPQERPKPKPAAVPVPDLPIPSVQTETVLLGAPELDAAPVVAGLAALTLAQKVPKLMAALRAGEGLPAYDGSTPLPPAPERFAAILTRSPFPNPISAEDVDDNTADIYIASIGHHDLSFDAIALPVRSGLIADALPTVQSAPAPLSIGDETEVDDRASTDSDISSATDAAMQLALGLPPPVSANPEPVLPRPTEQTLGSPTLPRPTEFAAALTDRASRARPSNFVDAIERQQFNGRTRSELADIRPTRRPESAQVAAARIQESAPVSKFAVTTSLLPKKRPVEFGKLVAAALVQREADRLTASLDFQTPDTSSAIEAALEADAEPEPRPQSTPRLSIPSNASVARQATIENAIRLNKVNLVGVYGNPSDRRALIRLPSGRYVKVKVGDRVDGGTIGRITDSEIFYRKGNRTLSLSLPKG